MRFDDRPDFKVLHDNTRKALGRLVEESADGPDGVDFSGDLATGRLLFLRGRFGGSLSHVELGGDQIGIRRAQAAMPAASRHAANAPARKRRCVRGW
jgi:hypothetical protein